MVSFLVFFLASRLPLLCCFHGIVRRHDEVSSPLHQPGREVGNQAGGAGLVANDSTMKQLALDYMVPVEVRASADITSSSSRGQISHSRSNSLLCHSSFVTPILCHSSVSFSTFSVGICQLIYLAVSHYNTLWVSHFCFVNSYIFHDLRGKIHVYFKR